MSKVPIRLIAMTRLNAARSCAESNSPSRPMVRCAQPMPAEFTHARSSGDLGGSVDRRLDLVGVRHVDLGEHASDLLGERLALVGPAGRIDHDRALRGQLARAAAAPMPDAPPVTIALAPLMSMAGEHHRSAVGLSRVISARSVPVGKPGVSLKRRRAPRRRSRRAGEEGPGRRGSR